MRRGRSSDHDDGLVEDQVSDRDAVSNFFQPWDVDETGPALLMPDLNLDLSLSTIPYSPNYSNNLSSCIEVEAAHDHHHQQQVVESKLAGRDRNPGFAPQLIPLRL
ncbi:hypothetical protein BVC80_479g110 [Macleaya cordata]|uniref:Uncharacterized protein n=1 Tax=Macleaya cordata TaxID=56857 RepID=A0A200Q7P7_MACCD|nr:hypothetical protein BVC80_479g110 [Macleaya cordata]